MRIRGYASRFEERDAGGDTVHRGAFAASLLSQARALPMLSDHQRQVGVWHRATEDENGLYVEGDVTDPALQRLIRSGRVSGLSIGYRTRRSRDGPGRRDLLELDLKEISVVAFPMLGSARIDTIGEDDPQHTPDDKFLHANHRRTA
jgi:HK97 family phage prohead protease